MRILGWRSVLYATAILAPCALTIAYGASTNRHVEIDQSFYVAVAQILPILLFAQVIRLSSVHSFVFASGERLHHVMRTTAQVESMRAKAIEENAGDALLEEIDELESEIGYATDAKSGLRQAETVIQLLFGCAFATWLLAIGGGAAVLADLAMKDDSLAIFLTAVLAVAWLAISLPMFELLLLTLPRRSLADEDIA